MKSILLSVVMVMPLFAQKGNDDKRMREAGLVFTEMMHAGDKGIPEAFIHRAQCVGVVPSLKRVGFIGGVKYGKGELMCRTEKGDWSAPSTIIVEGGSFGLQIGIGETDLVFTVMNRAGEDKLLADKFEIGGDASAMAGPIGRSAEANTDLLLNAGILAWSRARGAYAGVSLQGSTIRPDNDANALIYGHPVTQREILHGDVRPPAAAKELEAELARYPHKEH